MNDTDNKKKRSKSSERVCLSKSNTKLVEQLLDQVEEALPNLKLTKFDMVNWLLQSRGPSLTKRELAVIERTYFDPVKALEAVIVEVKGRQGMGEALDVEAIVNEKLLFKKRRPSKGSRSRIQKVESNIRRDKTNVSKGPKD